MGLVLGSLLICFLFVLSSGFGVGVGQATLNLLRGRVEDMDAVFTALSGFNRVESLMSRVGAWGG